MTGECPPPHLPSCSPAHVYAIMAKNENSAILADNVMESPHISSKKQEQNLTVAGNCKSFSRTLVFQTGRQVQCKINDCKQLS